MWPLILVEVIDRAIFTSGAPAQLTLTVVEGAFHTNKQRRACLDGTTLFEIKTLGCDRRYEAPTFLQVVWGLGWDRHHGNGSGHFFKQWRTYLVWSLAHPSHIICASPAVAGVSVCGASV